MDQVLFVVAGYAFTGWATAIVGALALAVVIVVAATAALRRDRARIIEMADLARDQLQSNFEQQLAQRDARIAGMEAEAAAQIEQIASLRADLAAARAAAEAQRQHAEENLKRFSEARAQMTDEFKAIAGDILRSHGETFSKQNREQVDLLLKPLGEKIIEFHSSLVKDRAEFGQRIQHLTTTGLAMSQEASNLARALKGSAQARGAWGEMILESVLDKSGLRKGEEYIVHAPYTDSDGRRVQTDVEVLLPDGGGTIVIDSKVSLNAYEGMVNSSSEPEQQECAQRHVASLRAHIKSLSGKEYQRRSRSAVDFVFMFVPIEGALAEAVRTDPNLITHAQSMGVHLVTPTTLMSALRLVVNLWDGKRREKNAEEIAERAGKLYDKVAGFVGNLDKLGTALDRARATFSDTRNQLAGGNGSIVRQIEMLRELGARTSKPLPESWLELSASTPALTAESVVPNQSTDTDEGARSLVEATERADKRQHFRLAGE